MKKQIEEVKQSDFGQKKDILDELKGKLGKTYRDEEIYWSQKARSKWLKHGDKNTAFFHAFVRIRRRQNRISGLQRENGSWCDTKEEMFEEISNHYSNIFNTSQLDNIDEVLDSIPHTISQQMVENLIKPVDEKEAKAAVFSMHPNKVPVPNGRHTGIP